MKPWLYCGAQIMCVDARGSNILSHGTVYTVRNVSANGRFVRLVEIVLDRDGMDGWVVDRFRPLVTDESRREVEAMRNLMLDATVSGKVDA